MNAVSVAMLEPEIQWTPSARGRLGMYCLIAAEAAIFTIFVIAYLFYMGKSVSGPSPRDVLHVPVVFTIFLLSSSISIDLAVRSLRNAKVGAFTRWWSLTFVLGAAFLLGTAMEWRHLIYDEGLTIQTNGQNLVDGQDPRAQAQWENAIEQLRQHGLLQDRGRQGEVFLMTDEGYQTADLLRERQLVGTATS